MAKAVTSLRSPKRSGRDDKRKLGGVKKRVATASLTTEGSDGRCRTQKFQSFVRRIAMSSGKILSTPWFGVEKDPWHQVEKDPWHGVEKDPWHGVEKDPWHAVELPVPKPLSA
jgi:hypothetical protein